MRPRQWPSRPSHTALFLLPLSLAVLSGAGRTNGLIGRGNLFRVTLAPVVGAAAAALARVDATWTAGHGSSQEQQSQELSRWLRENRLQEYEETLREIGVQMLDDLHLLEPEDLDDLGFNRIQKRKTLRALRALKEHSRDEKQPLDGEATIDTRESQADIETEQPQERKGTFDLSALNSLSEILKSQPQVGDMDLASLLRHTPSEFSSARNEGSSSPGDVHAEYRKLLETLNVGSLRIDELLRMGHKYASDPNFVPEKIKERVKGLDQQQLRDIIGSLAGSDLADL